MANRIAIEEAKARLNRTPLGAYELYITRTNELRQLEGGK